MAPCDFTPCSPYRFSLFAASMVLLLLDIGAGGSPILELFWWIEACGGRMRSFRNPLPSIYPRQRQRTGLSLLDPIQVEVVNWQGELIPESGNGNKNVGIPRVEQLGSQLLCVLGREQELFHRGILQGSRHSRAAFSFLDTIDKTVKLIELSLSANLSISTLSSSQLLHPNTSLKGYPTCIIHGRGESYHSIYPHYSTDCILPFHFSHSTPQPTG